MLRRLGKARNRALAVSDPYKPMSHRSDRNPPISRELIERVPYGDPDEKLLFSIYAESPFRFPSQRLWVDG